ncbi:DUF4189 domain-containing protein [Belnapia sp. T6]|uniref:DUF4189 domain-containing protein n=1 Tax=Belnapia mucosa TaxID=2804532 RepID=A0ABS1V4L6_9PROT|nr:DUF4189 domain-containing protein [Belnapia mucosa]MBL6456625.1 DUF4189 domain-containing protein [Belnapia mucosa]
MSPFRLAALVLLLASSAAAADSPACRAACGAMAQSRAANPVPVQACLIRCEASARYQAGLRGGQAAALGRVAVAVTGPVRGMPVSFAQPHWGAIYAAAPPAPQIGIAFGEGDRLLAHSGAAQRCSSGRESSCRMLLEFTERCGAVAQARRKRGILLTDHPSTYEVAALATGTGSSRAAAEEDALAQCRGRDGQSACRIAASACTAGT